MANLDLAVDLSGGLNPALDYPVQNPPADVPNYGENHAFWFFDDEGRFASTVHIETIHGLWRNRREFGWVWQPGGELLQFQNEGPATTREVVGGAAAAYRCDRPFEHWVGGYKGTARAVDALATARGPLMDGPRKVVEIEMDAVMAVPPWVMGGVSKTAALHMKKDPGDFIGGYRYEQLYRANVALTVDGERHTFTATGLRTHRVGPRNMGAMRGHSWMTTVFPSGRAFGLLRFPTVDGAPTYSEAFIYQDGRMIEAEIVDSPWLTSLTPEGERFPIVLRSELGESRLEGVVTASAYDSTGAGQGTDRGWVRSGYHPDGVLVLAQSGARFTWDGETAHGLLERSAPCADFR